MLLLMGPQHNAVAETQEVIVADGQIIDQSAQNTSSSYVNYTDEWQIPADKELTFRSARYTYIYNKVSGEGKINLYSGGERTFIGNSSKAFPNWSGFTGRLDLFPYKEKSGSNGFYGLILMHNGKVMTPDNAVQEANENRLNTCFAKSTLCLKSGTTLAIEGSDKNRGARIGCLEMEAGTTLMGYYKSKNAANSYYLIGGNNADATLAGRIAPASDNKNMLLGLIKEGSGTYRITGTNNLITGGIRILNGGVLINGKSEIGNLIVNKEAITGGYGTVVGTTQLYGTMQPGDGTTGTLTLSGKLTVRPTSRIDMQIRTAVDYDQLIVYDAVEYMNVCQDFSTSEKMPRLRIYLPIDVNLEVGDSFTLIEANSKSLYNNIDWAFDVRYPQRYTWEVKQEQMDGKLKVVATVVSLDYDGQGNLGYDDPDDGGGISSDDGSFDIVAERKDPTPLRSFVDGQNRYVGTCLCTWKMNISTSDAKTQLFGKEFNMVVPENEMKMDATEPAQNSFSFSGGDAIVNIAKTYGAVVRGHTLCWHSQVPTWISSDGYKNDKNWTRQQLLDILKNHIENVVGHWKGQIMEWDVCNEVLDDNQLKIWSNPSSYDLRQSIWATVIGEDYLDSAFVWTHRVDPDAKLFLNDYGVEGKGWGKSEALVNLANRLRNSGVPIDGIGLQGHMEASMNYFDAIEQNIARCSEQGLLCHITELDLGIDSYNASNLEMQGTAYYRLARMAMKYSNCSSLMIWGLTDDMTWRTGKYPLLFDSNRSKKDAYWGVHAALRQAAGVELDIEAVEESSSDDTVFDLCGQRVYQLLPGQMYISQGRKFIVK